MAGARIVVGVDDSPGARWALAWAIDEARLRHLPLLIVHATPLPYTATWALAASALGIPLLTEVPFLQEEGTAVISELLDDMTVPDDVEITTMSLLGEAGEILTSLVHDGDLLVVGRSDRGVLSSLMERSVRQYYEWHARTAVVIVPSPSLTRFNDPAGTVRPRGRTKRQFRSVQS